MLSDLRHRKFAAMYNAADVNDNGVLDRADFLAVAEKFAARNGWEEGSDSYAGIHELCARWWERMRASADIDGDGVVTLEEFCATLEGYDEAAFAPTAQLPALRRGLPARGGRRRDLCPARYERRRPDFAR